MDDSGLLATAAAALVAACVGAVIARGLRLPPLVVIDNVFASRHFAKLGTETSPFLGSDHKPVIVDLALAAPREQGR